MLSDSLRNVFVAAAVIGVAGCTTQAELEMMGEQQFRQIEETAPLVKDRRTINYVKCVADAIVEVLEPPHSELYWELRIIDTPGVNASVLPGGKIIVYSGLLDITQNQHQLAAVLGHEVAHVTAGHPKERITRQQAAALGIDTAALVLSGGYYEPYAGARTALSTASDLGLLKPYVRGQETEADLIGLEFMARAGFDPRESVELWKEMGKKNESRIPEYLSTHPSGETRIDNLIGHYPKALVLFNEAQAAGKHPTCAP